MDKPAPLITGGEGNNHTNLKLQVSRCGSQEKEEMLEYVLTSAEELNQIIRDIIDKSETVFTSAEGDRR